MNDFFNAVVGIAYPLRDTLSSDIYRHLNEEASSESLQDEVNRYVTELTTTKEGRNTVMSDELEMMDAAINKLVEAIVSKQITQDTIDEVRKFRQTFFVAASKCAGRQIAEDIKAAKEDQAIERHMWRQETRCEV